MTREDFYNIAKEHFCSNGIISKEEFDAALDNYAKEHSIVPWVSTKYKMPVHDGEYLVIHQDPYNYFETCSFSKKKKKFISWDSHNDCEAYYGKKDIKAWVELKRF